MRKAYIFVFNAELGGLDAVRDMLDKLPEVINWRLELPSTFFLVSELTADQLAIRIRESTKNKGRFIVAEITGNKQGWLYPKSWSIINNKPNPEP
jgi:small-conductance mechanosensitive channel